MKRFEKKLLTLCVLRKLVLFPSGVHKNGPKSPKWSASDLPVTLKYSRALALWHPLCNQISAFYMVYFFSKAEKSNLLALTDCVNAFFLRLAEILKLRKKAGESPSKWLFCCFFFVSLTWIQLCSLGWKMFNKKSIEFLKLFLPSSSHYCKAMSLISL